MRALIYLVALEAIAAANPLVQPKPVAHVRGWARYDLDTPFGVATVWAKDRAP